MDVDAYYTVFTKVLDSIGPKLNNYQFIKIYYTLHKDEPGLVEKHLPDDDLKAMFIYLKTLKPKALARNATAEPMRPMPTIPNVCTPERLTSGSST